MKSEYKHQKMQINIGIISLIGGCIAFCVTNYITVRNFIRQQEYEQQQTFNAALINDRLSIYKDACKAAGEIIGEADADSDSLKRSINNFEKLYWGEMVLINDDSVRVAAKKLRLSYTKFLSSDKQKKDLNQLKFDAAAFTQACRKSSADGWNKLLKKK